jgi:hypothetical protein
MYLAFTQFLLTIIRVVTSSTHEDESVKSLRERVAINDLRQLRQVVVRALAATGQDEGPFARATAGYGEDVFNN